MISKKIQDAFNGQINAETYSAYIYWSMSAAFENMNLRGFANWMRVQAQEEMLHAVKFYNHIVERGGQVKLSAIDAPPTEWSDPVAVLEDTLKHEKLVTSLIYKLVELAEAEKDYASKSLLQWFVDEQVEEESSAGEVLQKLKLAGGAKGALFMLDKEMAGRTFTPGAAEGDQ